MVGSAAAEPVSPVRSNGPSSNRVDLVILGDGYTATDIASGKYANDVDAVVVGIFGQAPYTEYQRYYNVVRVDVTSVDSGADHPASGVFKNTALDARYDCGGVQRSICVDTSKVNTIVTASIPAPNARDLILVLVNDPEYGGAGGSVAVASLHVSAIELVLHEVGHTFALLADEYVDLALACNNAVEPPEPNVTRQTERASIKWNVWIDPSTPVPTVGAAETPGLYEGGKYCPTDLYRPTFNSKMRSLGRPFSAINTEAHVKRLYSFVSPIDSFLPVTSSFSLPQGKRQTFSVAVPLPWTHLLDVSWVIDGVPVGAGPAVTLPTAPSPGSHTLTVTVVDPTPLVRNDPSQLLTATQTWTVTVTQSFTDHPLQSGVAVKAVHITELRDWINELRVQCGLASFAFADEPLQPGVTPVRTEHLLQLRAALGEAYSACGVPQFTYSAPIVVGATISAVHISEIRDAILHIEAVRP